MRKITSMVMSLIMLFLLLLNSICVTTTYAFSDIEGTKYELPVLVLYELGVVNGDLLPEKKVTRAGMIKFIVLMNNLESEAERTRNNEIFSDVNSQHWAAGYINVAYENDFLTYSEKISGDTTVKCFKPEEPITYQDAVAWCVKSLGYKTTSYISKANELKLLENIICSYSNEAIRKDIYILLWNTINAPIQGENKTVLEKYFYCNEHLKKKIEEIIIDYENRNASEPDEQEISFENNITLYNAIKKALSSRGVQFDFDDSQKIIMVKIENVTELNLSNSNISDISELKYFVSLKKLYLSKNEIVDVTPLSALKCLSRLELDDNKININTISSLYNNEDFNLNLSGNNITDISALRNLTNLSILSLKKNNITNINPIANLTNLKSLDINENQISDISPLANLKKLKILKINKNIIEDLSPLTSLIKLEDLYLNDNKIKDISSLASLIKLKYLNLNNNEIIKISAVSNLTDLNSLLLANNKIKDISALSNLKRLSDLNLYMNDIEDITSLRNIDVAFRLNLGKNNITDISSITALPTGYLNLEGNKISDFTKVLSLLDKGNVAHSFNAQNLSTKVNVNEKQIELPQIFKNQTLSTEIKGNVKVIVDKENMTIENVTHGDKVILTITKGEFKDSVMTYTFAEISGANNPTPEPTPEVPMTKYQITAKNSKYGEISPSGITEVEEGKSITYIIEAKRGYEIKEVLVDGRAVGKEYKYTFEDIMKNHTIEAEFIEIKEKENKEVQYDDVKENDWFIDAVEYVTEKGLMNGVDSKNFSPNTTATRGMLVTILYRLSKAKTNEDSIFMDVPLTAYYSKAVAWASKNGIVNGVGDNRFAPDSEITREQLVTILYRYSTIIKKEKIRKIKDNLLNFDDANKISDYAYDAFKWGVKEKIITGRTQKELVPSGTAKRAEVATMIMRFIER